MQHVYQHALLAILWKLTEMTVQLMAMILNSGI